MFGKKIYDQLPIHITYSKSSICDSAGTQYTGFNYYEVSKNMEASTEEQTIIRLSK